MGLYIRGNRYYFKKQIQGKVYYKAIGLRRGQESLLTSRLKQIEESIIAEHYGLPYAPVKHITFLDYADKYLKSKLHKKTLDRDRQRLIIIGNIWNDPPLSRIDKKYLLSLEKYLFNLKPPLRPSTVNRYFELLKHLFNLAIEDGYIKENPCRKFYKPFVEDGSRRALSKEEIVKILMVSKKIQDKALSNIQSLIYDLILFGLNTGMRLSEIINLKKSYIQEDVIFYPISETKHRRRVYSRKAQKVKIICLNKLAKEVIRCQPKKGDYVFPVKWRNPNCIFHVIQKIRQLSGVSDFTFHQLRHTVSTWLSSRVSLSVAKTVLGHSDLKTTLKYTHPEIREQKEGVAKIEEYFRELTE